MKKKKFARAKAKHGQVFSTKFSFSFRCKEEYLGWEKLHFGWVFSFLKLRLCDSMTAFVRVRNELYVKWTYIVVDSTELDVSGDFAFMAQHRNLFYHFKTATLCTAQCDDDWMMNCGWLDEQTHIHIYQYTKRRLFVSNYMHCMKIWWKKIKHNFNNKYIAYLSFL